jgi:hypothetical protein
LVRPTIFCNSSASETILSSGISGSPMSQLRNHSGYSVGVRQAISAFNLLKRLNFNLCSRGRGHKKARWCGLLESREVNPAL